MATKKSSNQPNRPSTSQSRRAQLASQREAEAKRARTQRIALVAGAVVVVAIIAIVVVALIQSAGNTERRQGNRGADDVQIVPPNANSDQSGVIVHRDAVQDGAPVVAVYSDFQCGGCIQFAQIFGPTLESLAQSGEIQLEYRTMTFRDQQLANDNSVRSSIAVACADTVGAYPEMVQLIFNGMTQTGFTDDQLKTTVAEQAGIAGEDLTSYQQCYDDRATSQFVEGTGKKASDAGVNTTPTIKVNDNTVDFTGVTPDEASVLKLIEDNA